MSFDPNQPYNQHPYQPPPPPPPPPNASPYTTPPSHQGSAPFDGHASWSHLGSLEAVQLPPGIPTSLSWNTQPSAPSSQATPPASNVTATTASQSQRQPRPDRIRRASTNSNRDKHCKLCGINVTLAVKQVETAKQKLHLLQEKVDVEQQLLQHEKKNFQRRARAVKQQYKLTQQNNAKVERSRQLEHVQQARQLEAATQQTIRQVTESYETKLNTTNIRLKQLTELHSVKQKNLLNQCESLESELEELKEKHQQEMLEMQQQQQQQTSTYDDTDIKQRLQQLASELEEKQMQCDSLEMQLLELERERDTSGLHSGSNNKNNVCKACNVYERQLNDANLQISELTGRQNTMDVRLSQERNHVETYKQKLTAMQQKRVDDTKVREQSKRLQTQLNEATEQLAETKLDHSQQALKLQSLQEQVKALKQDKETLASKLSDAESSNKSLQSQLVQAKQQQPVLTSHPSQDDETDHPDRTIRLEHEWHGDYTGIYAGQWSTISDKPDGKGTLRLDDGAIYEGRWCHGQPHGLGVWASLEGDLFYGWWKNGKKDGSFTDVSADGCVYRGHYSEGRKSGNGILTWPYGAHFTGTFHEDKRVSGTYVYADGRVYTGSYKEDRPHGYGVLKSPDDTTIYDGMWQLGEFIGS